MKYYEGPCWPGGFKPGQFLKLNGKTVRIADFAEIGEIKKGQVPISTSGKVLEEIHFIAVDDLLGVEGFEVA